MEKTNVEQVRRCIAHAANNLTDEEAIKVLEYINSTASPAVSDCPEGKKYEILYDQLPITIDDHKLYQIRALRYFNDVCKGDLGGYIESEDNLSHEGDCWVYSDGNYLDGYVYGNAKVIDDARIYNGKIHGNAIVSGNSCIRYGEEACDNVVVHNTHVNPVDIMKHLNMHGNTHLIDGVFDSMDDVTCEKYPEEPQIILTSSDELSD